MVALSSAAAPSADDEDGRARVLHAGARNLIALASQMRRAAVRAPDEVKRALSGAVARFERDLRVGGWDDRGIAAASYVLCAWLDEVVSDTPWGGEGAGLVEQFHGSDDGGARVLPLLSRLAEAPRENRALLELFHTCLSLGLTGGLRAAPDGAQRLDDLRQRVFLALEREPVTLSPPWHRARLGRTRPGLRRIVAATLVALGVLALAVYTASHLALASQVDAVFASMQQLTAGTVPPRPAAPAAAPRLAPLLAADATAGALAVRDEAHRSVVSVPAERLFGADSTQLSREGAALLGRVAQALAGIDGKVLVIGHTDGADLRSARLPSAWHQSFEWAREAAATLGKTLPAQRLSAEGAGAVQAGADSAPPRRVDIVLYP